LSENDRFFHVEAFGVRIELRAIYTVGNYRNQLPVGYVVRRDNRTIDIPSFQTERFATVDFEFVRPTLFSSRCTLHGGGADTRRERRSNN